MEDDKLTMLARLVIDDYDRGRRGQEARKEAGKLLGSPATNDVLAALLLAPEPPASIYTVHPLLLKEWMGRYEEWWVRVRGVAIERSSVR